MKEVIERWLPSNVDELRDALGEIVGVLYSEGESDLTAVYVDIRDLTLVKETLSDGSVVFNLTARENR